MKKFLSAALGAAILLGFVYVSGSMMLEQKKENFKEVALGAAQRLEHAAGLLRELHKDPDKITEEELEELILANEKFSYMFWNYKDFLTPKSEPEFPKEREEEEWSDVFDLPGWVTQE